MSSVIMSAAAAAAESVQDAAAKQMAEMVADHHSSRLVSIDVDVSVVGSGARARVGGVEFVSPE